MLYPVGHEEASQPRARHDRPVRLEDGRHVEDRREKFKSEEDRVTQRGAEGVGEQRRSTWDDRCDEGWRRRTRSERMKGMQRERQRKKYRKYRREERKNEGSEREVSRTHMAGQRPIENIEQDGEKCERERRRQIPPLV